MLIGENPIGSRPGIGESYIVRTKAYTMDQWVVFTGSEPLGEDGIRYHLNRNFGMGLSKSDSINFDMGYVSAATNVATYSMSTGLKDTLRGILMSVSLVPAYELTIPSSSVMNALVWAWAETFDSVWRKMETMANALKLEHATDTYLDDAWGQIFDLPRIYQETDTAYRDRLKTRTTILTSSGTKSNCETIIDSIIGMFGETTVTTRYPSTVQITFSSIDAIRIAKEKQDTLNYLIPQMVAAGISYSMYLPFIDYFMETYVSGPLTLSHTMRYALLHKNSDLSYEMNIANNIQQTIPYDVDMQVMNYYEKLFLVGSMFKINKTKSFTARTGLFGTKNIPLIMAIQNKRKNITKSFIMKQYIQKFNINKSHTITMLDKASLRRIYRLAAILTNQHTTTYDMELSLQLYAKSISMDVCNKRIYPKRHTMAITLVGA